MTRIISEAFHGHGDFYRVGDGLATTLGVRWPLSRLRRFPMGLTEHARPPRRTPLRRASRGWVSGANRASSWSVVLSILKGGSRSRGSVDADEVEGPELGKNATKPTTAEQILRTSRRVWVDVEPSAGLWITCGRFSALPLSRGLDFRLVRSRSARVSAEGRSWAVGRPTDALNARERQAVHR